jgi:outer membrane protein TolC
MKPSCAILPLLMCFVPAQAERIALPDPLTLEFALSQASVEGHPRVLEADASLEQSRSQIHQAASGNDLRARIDVQASVFEPSPLAADQSTEELLARLLVEKPLYDFGRSELLQESATIQHEAVTEYRGYLLAQQRLDIARRFYEVLLADLKFDWDNEAMAIAYVQFDSAQERHGLQQISDVELLAADTAYQDVRYRRYQSEAAQRSTRALLAEVMNRPGELSTNLQRPAAVQQSLPEYETLVANALQQNARLRLLQTDVTAAHKRVEAAQSLSKPQLSAQFQATETNIDRSSQDDWRASLNLTIPLIETENVKAEASRERSQWLARRAMLLQEQASVRQRVLVLWQQLQLFTTRLQQMQTAKDYRELYLDRSRALYEMEVKTDLGDAMVAVAELRYRQAEAEFGLALAWQELALLGATTNGERVQ